MSNLLLDGWHHFDAQVIALEQIFEGRNGGRIAAHSERTDGGHPNGEVRLSEIRGDLRGNFFVVFLNPRKAGDGGVSS